MPGMHVSDKPRGSCLRLVETSGILNSAVNAVASVAATEALKLYDRRSGTGTIADDAMVTRCLDE